MTVVFVVEALGTTMECTHAPYSSVQFTFLKTHIKTAWCVSRTHK